MASESDEKAVTILLDAQESHTKRTHEGLKVRGYTVDFQLNVIKKEGGTLTRHLTTFNAKVERICE